MKKVLTRQTLLDRLWDNEGNFIDDHTLTIYHEPAKSQD